MLANLSKEVTDRVRACRFVLASFLKDRNEVAAIVQKMNSVLSESIALARPKLVEALAQTQLH